MKPFLQQRTRLPLVAATAATLIASALVASPAQAADPRISASDAAGVQAAMQRAGVPRTEQDLLIAKLQSGQATDSEQPDARPVSVTEHPLPHGGTSRVESFADGSQRSTSTVPITIDGSSGPITTFTTYSCNVLHCTALLSKAQTRQMATGSAAAGAIVAALCGPVAWACAIGVGIMIDTANRAKNQGKCAGIRKFTTSAPVWPVIEPCRQ